VVLKVFLGIAPGPLLISYGWIRDMVDFLLFDGKTCDWS